MPYFAIATQSGQAIFADIRDKVFKTYCVSGQSFNPSKGRRFVDSFCRPEV